MIYRIETFCDDDGRVVHRRSSDTTVVYRGQCTLIVQNGPQVAQRQMDFPIVADTIEAAFQSFNDAMETAKAEQLKQFQAAANRIVVPTQQQQRPVLAGV